MESGIKEILDVLRRPGYFTAEKKIHLIYLSEG
jgi:hypothetical protein